MPRATEEQVKREIYKNGPLTSGIATYPNFKAFRGSGEFRDFEFPIIS